MPAAGGDERANTASTGPFFIKAFSSSEVDANAAAHFDDYLSYRSVDQVVKLAGQGARDWPEEIAASIPTVFDVATVDAAVVGSGITPGSLGTVTVNFVGVVAAGIVSGSTPSNLSFAFSGANSGIGVAGGGSMLVESSANESLQLDFEGASKFAFTLADFGTYSTTFLEVVQIQFFSGTTQVGATRYGAGCRPDGGLASFAIDAGVVFDRVTLTPLAAFNTATGTLSGFTGFLLSEIKTCPASEPTCTTSLSVSVPPNTCPVYIF
jgi:hypothetical protein